MSQPPTPVLLPSSPRSRADIRWNQITWFIIFTFVITWLIVLPLYFIKDPAVFQSLYTPVVVVMMFIPALVSWLRSEEHTSELQSRFDIVCRLLIVNKKIN